jgi:hypothetical protein
MKKKKLPVYELKINLKDDAIVSAIALVEEPAIESNFLAFNNQVKYSEFAVNDDRMELLGAAMIPDQLIYRIDGKTNEEFEVFFSKDTIREIAQQYLKYGFQNSMNLNHTAIPSKSYLFQSYIVDSSRGMSAPKGIDVPDGTWIIGVKVEDKNTWNDIKAGKVQGFSIEGMFEFVTGEFSIDQTDEDEQVLKILNELNELINKSKN